MTTTCCFCDSCTDLHRLRVTLDALGVHYAERDRCPWDQPEYWRQPDIDYNTFTVPETDKTMKIGTIVMVCGCGNLELHFDLDERYLGAEAGGLGEWWPGNCRSTAS